MSFRHVVVDGSNIATEGRQLPSLAQLDEAVREFQREYPGVEVTVVVDATFEHRIDPSERPTFQEAEAAGELVSPPAGAVGRGDAFVLRIAERIGAAVLSNDSFQEFHGEHEWLFEKDRLIGGKPVPGVGWIFTPRTPVRGPKSREATREAKRSRVRIGSKEASRPMPVPSAPPPGWTPPPEAESGSDTNPVAPVAAVVSGGRARRPRPPAVQQAIEEAANEAVRGRADAETPSASPGSGPKRRRGRAPAPSEAVNDPLTFITFIAGHPLGDEVEGEVESFTSHGAFVRVDGALAYVPLVGLGDPPPRRARDVVSRGETRRFVVQALDAPRRGIEVALPGFAQLSGQPSEETVAAEIEGALEEEPAPPRRRRRQKAAG
jgi:hypothetical protein